MGLISLFASSACAFVFSSLSFTTLARTQHPCYYGSDQIASDDLLPCYSSKYSDHYPCCMMGDKCLEHNACYDAGTGVTYQYACTDSTFQDESCPNKCNLDTEMSHWVGLVFCNGVNDTPNNTWVCHHPDNCGDNGDSAKRAWDAGLEKFGHIGCDDLKHDEEYVAFHESSTLSDIMALPVSSKLSKWWEQNTDRTRATTTPNTPSPAITISNCMPSFNYPRFSTTAPNIVASTAIITVTSTSLSQSTETAQVPKRPEIPKEKPSTIGLGLGIPLFFGLIGTGVYLYFSYQRRNRHRRCKTPSSSNNKKRSSGNTHELDESTVSARPKPPNLIPPNTLLPPQPTLQTPFQQPQQTQYYAQHQQPYQPSPQVPHQLSYQHSHQELYQHPQQDRYQHPQQNIYQHPHQVPFYPQHASDINDQEQYAGYMTMPRREFRRRELQRRELQRREQRDSFNRGYYGASS